MAESGRLVISCPDRAGIVATVADFLFQQGANITHSDQHSTDPTGGRFFLRVEFTLPGLSGRVSDLEDAFAPIATNFRMESRFVDASRRKSLAILVTKEDHCLRELLWQIEAGDLFASVARVISNHRHLEPVADAAGLPFQHIPVTPDKKSAAEAELLRYCADCDVVVLARYMQILSGDFLARLPVRVINIHHSFLPAFAGANPYRQAFERGVKLIGATAHYVTEELDAGPILEQGVERVDHRALVEELRRIGRHIERMVLARAVKWHVEDRVLVHGNRTVVFR